MKWSDAKKELVRHDIEQIIVDTSLNPLDASLQIMELITDTYIKHDIEIRIDELNNLPIWKANENQLKIIQKRITELEKRI